MADTRVSSADTARRPQDIPPSGWMDVVRRCWQEISDSNIFLIAGGVSYAIILALFPGLATLVSIYGLVLDADQIEQQVNTMSAMLPEQSRQLLADQLHRLASVSGRALGISAVVGLLLALWSASRGMSGLLTALTIAYQERERRGFVKFNLVAIGLTIAAIFAGLLTIALIAGLPAAIQILGLGGASKWLPLLLEWPLLGALSIVGLAVLYRYGPDRAEPAWRWVSPGAVAATILWILGSFGFTLYVANFASYDATYGSLGGAVIMLTWLYLSAFAVLFGAVVNTQIEQRAGASPQTSERFSR